MARHDQYPPPMPIEPDQPGGSHDPTRANDPIDPTRAQDPVEPTRVQPGVDPTRAEDATFVRPETRPGAVVDEPLRRDPNDDEDRKAAWWLWALLAAALIGIVLFALLRDNDDDSVGTDDQTDTGVVETTPEDTAVEDTTAETAPEDTTVEEPVTEDTTATTTDDDGDATAPGDGADGDPGTVITTDGTDLFTLVQGDAGDADRLADQANENLTGRDVYVLDVVDGQGIWIGADDQQRIFAHASPEVTAQIRAGVRISFDGFLKPNPTDDSADVHDIPEDQGAELHQQQGHHIEMRSVTAA
jgi:hypothetical protein